MIRLSKKRKRFVIGLLTAVVVGLVFCLVSFFNLLHEINLKSSDFLFRTANSQPEINSDLDIVVIAIDDKSLEELGRFSSWPRTYHARAIDSLSEAGARVIVFDILFSETTPEDGALIASMQRAGNVILPIASTLDTNKLAMMGETGLAVSSIRPLQVFGENALDIGHSSMLADKDGTVRRLPLLIQSEDGYEPALSLVAINSYLRRPKLNLIPNTDGYLSFAGRSIPLDGDNGMIINYRGDTTGPLHYQTVSYADVLSDDVNPDVFKDKIAVIGITAIGFGDVFWTPMGKVLSGVELHAIAMDTILTADFIRQAPRTVTYIAIILLALVCGLAVLRFRVLPAALFTIFIAVIYIFLTFYFFDQGIVLNLLYPSLAIAGTFAVVNVYNVASERYEKAEVTRTFGQFVSPSVATKILESINEGSLKLGGEEHQVSVLFADARNFTGMSEKMDPNVLVSTLNRYLSLIIESVTRHDGVVNKFGGDSIMAIWNTPVDCPDHALLATKAAISAQQAIRGLQKNAENLPRMDFGIGVNTGTVIAGNMGSVDRLEYSVIGDSVNTSARLASVTPGSKVWIGYETFELVKDFVNCIPLEPLTLKGKQDTFQAYEVKDSHETSPELVENEVA